MTCCHPEKWRKPRLLYLARDELNNGDNYMKDGLIGGKPFLANNGLNWHIYRRGLLIDILSHLIT
jgi:hypothetical protein